MYKCKHFVIKELVNPTLLRQIGEQTAWILFDERLLRMADAIREKFGACTVNASGLVDCGLRDPQSTTGAKYSMHKIGRALDLHIRSIELECAGDKAAKVKAYNRVREQLMLLPAFDGLNFENNISWLHIDTGNRQNRLFNP
jgi:uncharacterized protein YcbK (DUF882 family)